MIRVNRRMGHEAPSVAHSIGSFAAIVKQERARLNRFATFFSMITLSLGRHAANAIWMKAFLESASRRLRSIDTIGWIDHERIGIILPATDPDGARIVAMDIERIAIERGAPLVYTVARYPEGNSTGEQAEATGGIASGTTLPTSVGFVSAGKMPGWKRPVDFCVSLLGILLASPLMLFISLYIKLVSRGPVLFRQQRMGRHGRPFTILKFRTMKHGCSQETHQQHIRNLIHSGGSLEKIDGSGDARIIPGGRLLRKSCLDELPQLFCVLRGDMSIVGPRPCMEYEAREFQRWHRERFDTLPGLTGLWQVSGKTKRTFTEMMRLDISYSESLSFWLDLKIMLLTFPAIIQMVGQAVGKHLDLVAHSDQIRQANLLDTARVPETETAHETLAAQAQ